MNRAPENPEGARHEEDHQCEQSEAADSLEPEGQAMGQEAFNHPPAIQGGHRNEVKEREREVEGNRSDRHRLEPSREGKTLELRAPEHGPGQGRKDGQEEIDRGACKGHQKKPRTQVPEVARINRYRAGPAKHDGRRGQHVDDRQHQSAQKVDVGPGIHREPPCLFGRSIPKAFGHPAMPVLVGDHGEQEWNKLNGESFEWLVHR